MWDYAELNGNSNQTQARHALTKPSSTKANTIKVKTYTKHHPTWCIEMVRTWGSS